MRREFVQRPAKDRSREIREVTDDSRASGFGEDGRTRGSESATIMR